MVKVPKGYRSRNVQDRRGSRSRGGGGFGFPSRRGGGGSFGGGGLGGSLGGGGGGATLPGGTATGSRRGCGGGVGMILVIVVVALLVMQCRPSGDGVPQSTGDRGFGASTNADTGSFSVEENASFDLVNAVLDDVQAYWTFEFESQGWSPYPAAGLVIFDDGVNTGGCGFASSNVGPFYCPADSNAYIDLQFMFRLQRQLGAEGDFAQAYILAHEIGHHVQNVRGVNQAVRQAQSVAGSAERNRLNVYMELQADCLAGMWARDLAERTQEILASGDQELIENSLLLEDGDLSEGVQAAGAVGDDAITGSSNAENFTHGTSEQRVRWFTIGFDQQSLAACNTFPDGAI